MHLKAPWGCDWPRPVIHIDPGMRFGKPQIGGVSCEAFTGRVRGGDAVEEVAADFGVTRAEVLLACWWVGLNSPAQDLRAWAEDAGASLARAEYDQVPDPPKAGR